MEAAERAEWIERRKNGLGGSDAAAALGLSRWKTPLRLWAEKTGLVDEPDLSDNAAVLRGSILEPAVAKLYEMTTGRRTREEDGPRPRFHPTIPFLFVDVDRYIDKDPPYMVGEERPKRFGDGVLEIKTTMSPRLIREWREEPPIEAQVQAQHGLLVTGLQWCSYAGLIGPTGFEWHDQERNEDFLKTAVEKLDAFWKLVKTKTEPAAQGPDVKLLGKLYEVIGEDATVTLPEEAEEWDEEYEALGAEIKRLEEKRDTFRAMIVQALDNAKVGILRSGRARWNMRTTNVAEKVHKAYSFTTPYRTRIGGK